MDSRVEEKYNGDAGKRDLPTRSDSLKAYLITTGTLFGLFAAMHLVRVVEKWDLLATDPWFVLGNALIAVPSGALCLWAWRLFWRPR